MVFNILAIVAFALSSLNTLFLGTFVFSVIRAKRAQADALDKLRFSFGGLNEDN